MKLIESDKTIENTTFSDIDLNKENVSESTFHKCLFLSCQFNESTFTNCSFEKCDFQICELTAFRPENCWLDEVSFQNCRLMGVDFSLLRDKLPHSIQFDKCKLDLSVFGKVELKETHFNNCSIRESSFIGTNLSSSKFGECDLSQTRFEGVNLEKVDFRTSFNYSFDPSSNNCKDSIHSLPEATNLLEPFGIKIVSDTENV